MNTTPNPVTLRPKRDKHTEGMTAAPKTTWKQTTLRLPAEVHRAMKIRSAEEGRPVGVIIEDLIRGYLVEGRQS